MFSCISKQILFYQVALKYQNKWSVDGSRVEGHYGWIVVGSHTLGSSAWEPLRQSSEPSWQSREYVNHHLSIVMSPYLNSGE